MAGVKETFDNIDKNLDKFQEEFLSEFLSRVERRTPRVTGRLADSWTGKVAKNKLTVTNPTEYASFIEYGTIYIAPRAMLRTTAAEADQIAEIAAKKAGLK